MSDNSKNTLFDVNNFWLHLHDCCNFFRIFHIVSHDQHEQIDLNNEGDVLILKLTFKYQFFF